MKLVLRGYSQDVDLVDQSQSDNFLVFQDEETGNLARIPVPWATIEELIQVVGLPETGEEEAESAPPEEPQVEEEEEEEPPSRPAPQRRMKTMPQTPAPHVYSSARQRIQTPRTEDDVPSM